MPTPTGGKAHEEKQACKVHLNPSDRWSLLQEVELLGVPSHPRNFGLNYKQNYEFKCGIQNNALVRTLISKPFTEIGWAHKLYNVWS